MNVEQMTRKDFEALPYRESWNTPVKNFDSLIILPLRRLHDSGYRCLDFVACSKGEPICRLSGCSDVLHINGIGGFGYKWFEKNKGVPQLIPPVDWSIDCLRKSGLLRLFIGSPDKSLRADEALSSFCLYSVESE